MPSPDGTTERRGTAGKLAAAARLTPKQRAALRLLFVCESTGDGWGVVSDAKTEKIDGQAWVHWRTAISLWMRDLVEVDEGNLAPEEWPEEPRLRLTSDGREAIR
jgi:hypothetical protein